MSLERRAGDREGRALPEPIPDHTTDPTGATSTVKTTRIRTAVHTLDRRARGAELDWTRLGLIHEQRVYAAEKGYKPVDVFWGFDDSDIGVELVLEQGFDGAEARIWHLNQDLVFALGLHRECDVWTRPQEGFVEVARLTRDAAGVAEALEIRAEHLRDYLAARRMALRVVQYRQREAVLEDAAHIHWPDDGLREDQADDRFETRRFAIHEGGSPFGSKTAVLHVGRNDVDPDLDVPVLGESNDSNTTHRSWSVASRGRRLWRISGELWRNEWIEPAEVSGRVRGDHVPSSCSFVVDAAGRRESADALNNEDVGKWLWFRPDVVDAVSNRRGGALRWYTRDTGECSGLYGCGVHFGLNSKDLITAYAHDVAQLPEWLRLIWAGHNVSPDGKVSEELLAAQVRATPASTTAPEEFLARSLLSIDEASMTAWKSPLFRVVEARGEILKRCHRFRSKDEASFLALAKDVARLTADSIDPKPLQAVSPLKRDEKRGSLKSLEYALATLVPAEDARRLLGPLFGVYDLRVGDAHLPTKDFEEALNLVGIDHAATWLQQGMQLLQAVSDALDRISKVIARCLANSRQHSEVSAMDG